ncbi:MAG: TrkA family potassium uptake protein [Bacteroidales bacterium]|nr:TrkA family potassium uptake protein [Bacteroidales bacterium]
MKVIIIGLGNFGRSLAQKLTLMGHEVIGVDNQMVKVETLKESITHTVCLDCTDQHAVGYLPLKETDLVVVAIGEDQGSNILATALLKQLKVKRLISRAISVLHQTILEAMGVDEIVHPEEETAERWAKKINNIGIIDSFDLANEYSIVEAKVPEQLAGMTLAQAGLRRKYNVIILTTIKVTQGKNLLGIFRKSHKVQGIASPETLFEKDDILVLFGKNEDIQRMIRLE